MVRVEGLAESTEKRSRPPVESSSDPRIVGEAMPIGCTTATPTAYRPTAFPSESSTYQTSPTPWPVASPGSSSCA